MDDGRHSDEDLFAAYLRGEDDAFGALVARWTPSLRSLARRGGIPDAEVDELVQDVFLHLHRSSRDFRQGQPLRPWIVTIALNLRREWSRRAVRRVDTSRAPADGVVQPPATLEARDTARQVHHALDGLPDPQREVIELHWFAELPFPEIARLVGASVSAVKVRAHRGYERLRATLHEAVTATPVARTGDEER